jgi:diaminohydroxyphosphoribosylaminopyrimidine deaminase / 5-amino-6-(5-phosphoribosylamino)uracil reductase
MTAMEKWILPMRLALNAAEKFVGATAPNPPVGCIALDSKGKVLLGAGHQGAGKPHAEATVLDLAAKLGRLAEIETLVVTLEPCNHFGKTPPCTQEILKHKQIKRIVLGVRDPNPRVEGGGMAALKKGGLEVIEGVMAAECSALIRSFGKWSSDGRPWVTLKAAFTHSGSMIPPKGQKTFTSPAALTFSHELRKRADALWTGSGTVLADQPEFTVRRVPDHPNKKRWLVISDRRKRVDPAYLREAQDRGFVLAPNFSKLEEGLAFLGDKGVLEVLVEAGPTLYEAWLQSGLWDESVVIKQGTEGADEDIEIKFRSPTPTLTQS